MTNTRSEATRLFWHFSLCHKDSTFAHKQCRGCLSKLLFPQLIVSNKCKPSMEEWDLHMVVSLSVQVRAVWESIAVGSTTIDTAPLLYLLIHPHVRLNQQHPIKYNIHYIRVGADCVRGCSAGTGLLATERYVKNLCGCYCDKYIYKNENNILFIVE